MKKDEYPIVFAEDLFGEGNTTLAETLRLYYTASPPVANAPSNADAGTRRLPCYRRFAFGPCLKRSTP